MNRFIDISIEILLAIFLFFLFTNIFLTQTIRFPVIIFAAILFLILVNTKMKINYNILFRNFGVFLPYFIAVLLYRLVGNHDFKYFLITNIRLVLTILVVYASLHYSTSKKLLIYMTAFLMISFLVLFISRQSLFVGYSIRHLVFANDEVGILPTGLTLSTFHFGYHICALMGISFFILLKSKKTIQDIIISSGMLFIVVYGIFFGLNRSVVIVAFVVLSILLLMKGFSTKTLTLIVFSFVITVAFFNFYEDELTQGVSVITKNEKSSMGIQDRLDMQIENLEILFDHPFGLIFENLTWDDVTKDKKSLEDVTSHNAYLMFITFVGFPLGVVILFYLFWPTFNFLKFFYTTDSDNKNYYISAMFVAFIALALNSSMHNASLFTGYGLIMFTYVSVVISTRFNYLLKTSN